MLDPDPDPASMNPGPHTGLIVTKYLGITQGAEIYRTQMLLLQKRVFVGVMFSNACIINFAIYTVCSFVPVLSDLIIKM